MLLSRLSNSAMKPVIGTNWVERHLENCVAVGWNYGLQQRSFKMSFKASLDMPGC